MKLTKSQQKDLDTILYFKPEAFKNTEITDKDIEMFFEWSERGLHKDKIGGMPYKIDGLNALVQGKEWRGVHMRMWEQGVLDGSVPYFDLLGGNGEVLPRQVVDFMKKEMFKSEDKQLIEKVYTQILENSI